VDSSLQFFLGSVAQKLLREAACDVLISRATGEARDEEALQGPVFGP
jgi:hypothetical protein